MSHVVVPRAVDGRQAQHGLPQQRCRRGIVTNDERQNALVARWFVGVGVLTTEHAARTFQALLTQWKRQISVAHFRVRKG